MRQGDEAREAGQLTAAIGHYSEALEVGGGSLECHLKRASILCLQKEHKRALSDVDSALEIDRKNAEVYKNDLNFLSLW